jgi:hypothetical protein
MLRNKKYYFEDHTVIFHYAVMKYFFAKTFLRKQKLDIYFCPILIFLITFGLKICTFLNILTFNLLKETLG